MTDSNMSLWNSVRTPDPAATKPFSRGGGFKGTATSAVYLIQRATELWGPMGGKWGVEVMDEKVLDGAPMLADGVVIGHEQVHTIRINLRHPDGVVPGIGQTTFVGKNKNGYYTDEEAPKKSLTDALTKAMSWLGFAADIHMGRWDDNKYVNAAKRVFGDEPVAPSAQRADGEPANETAATVDDAPRKATPTDRVRQAVADGNAEAAAAYLAGLDQPRLDAIWSQLTADQQQQLTAAWPSTTEESA